MKVAIIGATGRAGKLIAKEAYDRGHEITAIVIDPENLDNENYAVINKSIFDLTADDLKDFDTVINCFGAWGDKVIQYQTSMMTMIDVFQNLPDVRLMIIGGAASLYTDETKTKRVLETIPEAWNAVPKNAFKAFQNLLNSDLENWLYFSPAGFFDPDGGRTGEYVINDNDVAILNDDGESYISYADFAVAMVDEMENKKYIGKRITAVSNKVKPAEAAPAAEEAPAEEAPAVAAVPANEIPLEARKDITKPQKFEGLSQYRGPFDYELGGKSFHLVLDNGYEYLVKFLDGETLVWAEKGKPFQWETYECLKGDESTYFVNIEVGGQELRTGASLILDLEQSLVTVLVARQGENKALPKMVTTEFIFGAIKVQGKPLPRKRHGYTTDLVGKRIHWQYSPYMSISHIYYNARYYRVGNAQMTPPPGSPPRPQLTPEEIAERQAAAAANPYDEPCDYVKIKENLYVFSFIEESFTRLGRIGNSMAFLIDTARMHDVGRSFGLATQPDGSIGTENYMFCAYGCWEDDFDGMAADQNSVYRV